MIQPFIAVELFLGDLLHEELSLFYLRIVDIIDEFSVFNIYNGMSCGLDYGLAEPAVYTVSCLTLRSILLEFLHHAHEGVPVPVSGFIELIWVIKSLFLYHFSAVGYEQRIGYRVGDHIVLSVKSEHIDSI